MVQHDTTLDDSDRLLSLSEASRLQGLSVSSDNRTLALSRREFNERDLMLLDVR